MCEESRIEIFTSCDRCGTSFVFFIINCSVIIHTTNLNPSSERRIDHQTMWVLIHVGVLEKSFLCCESPWCNDLWGNEPDEMTRTY